MTLLSKFMAKVGKKGIVDESILANLRSIAYVINVARGFILKQEDLIISLQNNQIAETGLDVLKD